MSDNDSALRFTQAVVVVVVNFGYGCVILTGGDSFHATVAQRAAIQNISLRARELEGRIRESCIDRVSCENSWRHFDGKGLDPIADLVASLVDCPARAGCCDALDLIPPEWADFVFSEELMFPDPPEGLSNFPGFFACPFSQYAELTARLWRFKKARLRASVRGGGTVFPVQRAGGKQGEVFHATRVSEACARPPMPRHLASLSGFVCIELGPERLLRVTKRDARCYFDQFRLPPSLIKFIGRPSVTVDQLRKCGIFHDDIVRYGVDSESTFSGDEWKRLPGNAIVWPCWFVWRMGFAWSSYIAQESLFKICVRSGLLESMALGQRKPVPGCDSLFFSLATDDTMICSTAGPGHTLKAARRLEIEMARAGVEKHPGEDEDDVLNCTCVGVALADGRWWWPPGDKMTILQRAVFHLGHTLVGSSAGLASMLGSIQWFDMLQRGQFAFYDAFYREACDYDDHSPRVLPMDCIREILASAVVLAPFWVVDMRLGHLDLVAATDASGDYGIGGCVAPASRELLSSLVRVCERDGAYVTLTDVTDKVRSRSLRDPLPIPFRIYDLAVIFGHRLTDNDHINLREASALFVPSNGYFGR